MGLGLRPSFIAIFIAALAFACGSERRGSGNSADGGAEAGSDASQDAQKPADRSLPSDTGPDLSNVLVYAHSRDTLYSFSPETAKVESIGAFFSQGGGEVENILDIAIDADGSIVGIGKSNLYNIDKETAEVSEVGALSTAGSTEITGLVFVPKNMFRSEEALVGADNEGVVYEIDRDTAQAEEIGIYPDGWISSGDLVAVDGLGTYATVKKSGAEFDQLVSVTFGSGGVSRMELLGPVSGGGRDYKQLFGVAYWGAHIYGFTLDGELLEIDRDTAQAKLISSDTGAESFWGAGVTTQVPVIR